ncbi:DNA-binding protein [Amycolatopsis sp. NBRC 101858]|nr:DNA-binding protein [Amycolatopsis sp. NBRC 101858]
MRLEAEFTSEPFRGEGSPPEHALAARDAAAEAGLETDFGPLGTLVRGEAKELYDALPAIAKAALDNGATQVTLQVRRLAADGGSDLPAAGHDGLTTGEPGHARAADGPGHVAAASEPGHVPATGEPGHVAAAGEPGHVAAASEPSHVAAADGPVVELHDALARLIADVERELGAPLGELDRAGKQRAVRLLRERGAFGLRKSVSSVADALGVTRFTVYNYLNREAD